jgi:hypothetical protein
MFNTVKNRLRITRGRITVVVIDFNSGSKRTYINIIIGIKSGYFHSGQRQFLFNDKVVKGPSGQIQVKVRQCQPV